MKKLTSEKWIHSEYAYRGTIFSVRFGTVQLSDRTRASREMIEHSGGAAALPVLDDGSVVLVRQFRIAIGQVALELPGGRLNHGETPEACARRELEEELAYQARDMSCIAEFYSSPGFTNEKNTIFIASKVKKTRKRPERGEAVVPVILKRTEVEKGLRKGRFDDANTIIALYAFLRFF